MEFVRMMIGQNHIKDTKLFNIKIAFLNYKYNNALSGFYNDMLDIHHKEKYENLCYKYNYSSNAHYMNNKYKDILPLFMQFIHTKDNNMNNYDHTALYKMLFIENMFIIINNMINIISITRINQDSNNFIIHKNKPYRILIIMDA